MFKNMKMPKLAEKSLKFLLAINIIAYRKENDSSREEFAELCDLSPRQVTNMEKCKVSVTLDTLEKISEGTHLSAQYLITDHRKQ